MISAGTNTLTNEITHTSPPSQTTHSIIEMFLIDNPSLLSAQHTSKDYITWSDHAPITLTVSHGPNYPARPPWSLNNLILKFPDTVSEIQDHLTEYF